MEIIELRRGDFIYRGAAGRGMGVLGKQLGALAAKAGWPTNG